MTTPKCAITRACYYTDRTFQRSYSELAEGYGFSHLAVPGARSAKEGPVEAGVKYVKNGFVPLRTFRCLTDANEQLTAWVLAKAATPPTAPPAKSRWRCSLPRRSTS